MKFCWSILFTFILAAVYAQNPVTEYYNKNFSQVKKENAVYYRIITYDDSANPVGMVHDYYLSGKMQWEGYLNKKKESQGHCIWYYENGRKQLECDCVDGYYIGHCKSWYESGQLESEGNFVPGNGNERRGKWTYYYENGKLQLVGNFTTNDKMDSVVTLYYDNGKIWARGNYVAGEMQGIGEYYDEKGKKKLVLMSEGYSDIILCVKSAFYLDQLMYKNKFGKKRNADLDNQLHFYGLDTGFANGKCVRKYDNGNIYAEFTLSNDKMEGAFISYNKDGTIDEEGSYLHNYKNGIWKSYSPKGQLWEVCNYTNGKRDGVLKRFSGGIQTEEYNYVNGLRQGNSWKIEFDDYYGKPEYRMDMEFRNDTESLTKNFKMWYVDSLTFEKKGIMADGNFSTGFQYSAYYYENGQPARLFHLDSTGKNGKYEYYYPNGKLQMEGEIHPHIQSVQNAWDSTGKQVIINGNGTLTEKKYYHEIKVSIYENGYLVKQTDSSDNGAVRWVMTYKNGIKDGSEILYRPDGKKQQETIYVNGHVSKTFVWYENGNLKQEMEFGNDMNTKNGVEIHYFENGQKQSEYHFNNGKNTGTSQVWDASGRLVLEITYDEFGYELEKKQH